MKYIIVLFLIAITGCSGPANTKVKNPVNPKAVALNDSAMKLLRFTRDSLSIAKAILVFDQATAIDNNYYIAYWNKRAFQMQIGQYANALATSKELIRLKPATPDFYSGAGIVCELMGDTVSSQTYFQKANTVYESILDTLQTATRGYEMMIMGQGMNLIMLGEYEKGNNLLHKLYDEDNDEAFRNGISLYLDKDKKAIIEMLRKNGEATSSNR